MNRSKTKSQLNKTRFISGVSVGVVLVFLIVIRYILVLTEIGTNHAGAYQDGEYISITANVENVSIHDNQLKLYVFDYQNDNKRLKDTFRVYTFVSEIAENSIVKITGTLKLTRDKSFNEGENYIGYFSYPDIEIISSTTEQRQGVFERLRQKINYIANSLSGEPYASLLVGIVFGIERDFPQQTLELLKSTGVVHIVVASGFNALIVAQLFSLIFSFFDKNVSFILTVFFLFVYAGIAEFQIPILRAIVMTMGSLFANRKGEYREGFRWLLASAYILLLYQPMWIESISFQLSFLASLGLIVATDKIQTVFRWLPVIIRETFTTTLVAQLFTLPVILFHFGTVSWIGLLVNILVLPVIPIIMIGGGVSIVISFLSINLGYFLIQPIAILMHYFWMIVMYFGL